MKELRSDSAVLQNLFRKKELLEKKDPEHEKIRPLLLCLGGGMCGVNGAGMLAALEKRGFTSVFDNAIGVSAGACNIAYFLAGTAKIGKTIYYEECARHCIKYFHPRKVFDLDFLERVFREGPKKLDVERVKQSRTQFFVLVTDACYGSSRFLNVKTADPDLVTALKGTATLLGFYNFPTEVNGRQWIDGGFSNILPLKDALLAFNPTDVLILVNNPREFETKRHAKSVELLFLLNLLLFSKEKRRLVLKLLTERKHILQKELSFLEHVEEVNIDVWVSPKDAHAQLLTRNKKILREAGNASYHMAAGRLLEAKIAYHISKTK